MVESLADLCKGPELAPEAATLITRHTPKHECPDIYLDDHAMDLKFSPTCNMLALGQITGAIRVYAYAEERMDEILTLDHHKESVRSIDFSPYGNIVYAGSKDGAFSVISNGRLEGMLKGAHDESINKVMHIENDHVIASGDDDGVIKLWDLRMAQSGKAKSCAMTFEEHEGSISDFEFNAEHKMLLSVANDGMLGVFDLRKSNLYAMSDSFEVDLNAVTLAKENKKVLTAAGDGIINIFSWDWFGDCNDRIVGHPNSVECMVKYDENTLITGGEDGLIRAVSVLPNRVLAILGDPLDTEDEVFHVQKITLSHCKTLVASCSLDDIIKVIDVSNLAERPTDGSFNLEAYERQIQEKLVPNHGKVFKAAKKVGDDEEMEEVKDGGG